MAAMEMPWKAQPPAYVRLIAVEMVQDGHSVEDVAVLLGITPRTVWRWLRAWNSGGQTALAASPRSGRPPKLTAEASASLLSWLDHSPCEFGFLTERWTARRLASVLLREKKISVNHRYLSDWLARHDITPQLPQRVPRERDDAKVAAWAAEQWPRIKKKIRREHATLGFSDESGFLLMPLVCRTLAHRGQTPRLLHRARQRDKVSVAAALTLSPTRGHLGLHYQTFPNGYVNAEMYAAFVRRSVLRCQRGPLILIHDQGSMHKGPFLRALAADYPRLEMHFLPSYAPEFNPTEPLWKHAKFDELGNFVPMTVRELDHEIHRCLDHAGDDQDLLRSFFATARLPWDGLTGLF